MSQSPDRLDSHDARADESTDSALQYVAIDLLENDCDADAQRDLLDPVAAELDAHLDTALRDGMREAFRHGADTGAAWTIQHLRHRLTFEGVPKEHRADVERLVTRRLREKRDQLAMLYEETMTEALRRASENGEDVIARWEAVV